MHFDPKKTIEETHRKSTGRFVNIIQGSLIKPTLGTWLMFTKYQQIVRLVDHNFHDLNDNTLDEIETEDNSLS